MLEHSARSISRVLSQSSEPWCCDLCALRYVYAQIADILLFCRFSTIIDIALLSWRSKLVADANDVARLLNVWQSRVPEKGHVSGVDTVHSYFLLRFVGGVSQRTRRSSLTLTVPEADVGGVE